MGTIKNVLFIMCDQLRWDHLAHAGHPHIRTPNLDALAARGVRFAQHYVQSGICGPSRMSAYTGRYVASHGATHNRVPLSVGEVTLGWHLRESGRTLALAGKTHVLPDVQGMRRLLLDGQDELAVLLREGWFTLLDRHDGHHAETQSAYAHWLRTQGYDSPDPWTDFVIAVTAPDGTHHSGWKMRNVKWPARIREEHSETAYTTDHALRFIEQQGEQPWVLHLSYVKPHWPYVAPAPYHAMYGPEACLPVRRHAAERGPDIHPALREFQNEEVAESFQREDCIANVRPAYQGLITQLDGHLGRVWALLDRMGRWEDTLVLFTSDHGDYLGDHWLGEKELFHDCIQRVPMLAAAPGGPRGAVVERFTEAVDLVPTILDALGLDAAEHVVEGRSLMPFLRGEAPAAWRGHAISELDWTFRGARRRLGLPTGQHRAFMIRDADWKYVHWTSGLPPQLYDLRADPDEFHDRGTDPALEPVRVRLREALWEWASNLKCRTTLTWAEAEFRTDRHKAAGVYFGEW